VCVFARSCPCACVCVCVCVRVCECVCEREKEGEIRLDDLCVRVRVCVNDMTQSCHTYHMTHSQDTCEWL